MITHATNRVLDPNPPALPTHTLWRLATDASGTPTLRPTRWVGSEQDMLAVMRTPDPTNRAAWFLTADDCWDHLTSEWMDGLDAAIDEITGGEVTTWAECGGNHVAIVDWVTRYFDTPDGPITSEILLLVEVES